MKFTNILDNILGHKSKVKTLRYLLNSGLELTGRQLSRALGIHHRTCHNALKELASFGVVVMRQSGKAIAYKVNNNNLLIKRALKPLFELERNLLPKTIEVVLSNDRIYVISAIVFGSIASSSERGTSDIDVLFLVSTEKERRILADSFDKIGYDFILEYGNMFSPLVLTIGEFQKRLKQKDKLIRNIVHEGKSVYGKTIQEVLAECQRRK